MEKITGVLYDLAKHVPIPAFLGAFLHLRQRGDNHEDNGKPTDLLGDNFPFIFNFHSSYRKNR